MRHRLFSSIDAGKIDNDYFPLEPGEHHLLTQLATLKCVIILEVKEIGLNDTIHNKEVSSETPLLHNMLWEIIICHVLTCPLWSLLHY